MKYVKFVIDNKKKQCYMLRAFKFIGFHEDHKKKELTIKEKSDDFVIEKTFEGVNGWEMQNINIKRKAIALL
ncbi:MAG: hypothetical protein IJ593_00115 [Lachnospiraceae bacterium]|nr:hypothetical protein [Lachnospiraceae bacterium]